MADKEIVVFHCALSQQRGPTAALRYMRERQSKTQRRRDGDLAATVEGEGEGEGEIASNDQPAEQEVYVLDRGFVGWQQKYGTDERLTDAYAPDIWVDY